MSMEIVAQEQSGILYKKELARKFNMSQRQLRDLINKNTDVLSELEKLNYSKNQKYLTPKQVSVLYKVIGSPDEYSKT